MTGRLRVGFLHVGRERSGVRRYGHILADEAALRPDLEVLEADVGDRSASVADLRAAARSLRDADVVHVQWKLADWGPRSGGLPRLGILTTTVRQPLVFTLHDVFGRTGVRERWLSMGALGLRRLGRAATRIVVHFEEERRRLDGMVPQGKMDVVPHFVEQRAALPDREAARAALGLTDHRVVTLLGYITKRRGHRLVIDALSELPEDVAALFVGSPIEGRDHMGRSVEEHAVEVGVRERVRFTGYVPDEELERILVATDVALCPFRDMSASGSLATWISVARPIVTSDLPAFREYEALAPGSMRMFSPYESRALAAAVRAALEDRDGVADERVRLLAEQLATPRVVERYAAVYRAAARER